MTAILLAGRNDADMVFSSRTSPNGSLVAEDVMIGDGEAGGRLAIHAKDASERNVDSAVMAPNRLTGGRSMLSAKTLTLMKVGLAPCSSSPISGPKLVELRSHLTTTIA